ncbi:MAG: amino acid permease [candidate division KSB1 bacterium]|nr:amino acid permease [candidate division KSB1 bacterium]MDZ7333652.1 amino acid permease [candidate division KSB1 bacterium]MDZ7356100.1 amino acid permease [candidate division KSB1 bacterium]MDZ7375642.1 amino acid permease [candidate division KSB1 bacterium]MDZ7398923.1 amino acid permease [candidate division KSB1 bacterium]
MSIKAKLTVFDTTMIVVSLVIGIGIFRTPAMVAAATRTPLLFFMAWILGGLISLCGALTFAEIGSRFTRPGAYYEVVADCYHSSLAFMLNWANLLIIGGAGAAAVSMIGAEYLVPIIFPKELQTQSTVQFTAAGAIMVLFAINFLGIKMGARTQNVLTVIKIAMILAIILAAFSFKHSGLTPQIPPADPQSPSQPFYWALAVGLISVFYTYGGYQGTINFGGDVQKPKRNIPLAIFFGIAIIISLYLLVNFAYYRVLGVEGMITAKLVAAEVARYCFGNGGYFLISLAIFLSAFGFLNVNMMQTPRAYYAMAQDRVLPAIFKRVNPRTQTQEFSLIFYCATILLSIFLLGTFEKLVNYVMFLDSLNLAIVAATIFVLRHRAKKEPDQSEYQVPLYPIVPAIFVIFLLSVSLNVLLTEPKPALFGSIIFVLGLPIFWIMRKIYPQQKNPTS